MTDQQRQIAENLLASITGLPVRSYSTYDFGRAQEMRCASVVQTPTSGDFLGQVRAALPAGLVAFRGTGKAEFVVGPGNDQFDILRLAHTDAVNYDMGTEEIIVRLRQYDAEVGIDITDAESDRVDFNILGRLENPAAFAADIYEFCPDVVNQGVGDLDALEMQIEIMGAVWLWWD